MVDCKTGLIGIIIVVATMIIFTRKQLPKFINARNGLLFIGVLSIALATTSLLDEFSDLLLDMGETVSVFSRQAVWFRAIQLFVKSPVWGYGIRTNDGYRELINLSTGWGYFSHPHNYILYVLIQGGILELMLISYLTGSCRLCKPCHKKLNEPCAHPDIRTFSYEALGVNVSSMVHDIFGIDLLWYAKGSLPLYTCVVAGLLSNQMMLDDRIIAKIKEFR